MVAQPTDVVKVRMQAQAAGEGVRYTGCMQAYTKIATEEGVRGLWKGIKYHYASNKKIHVIYENLLHSLKKETPRLFNLIFFKSGSNSFLGSVVNFYH